MRLPVNLSHLEIETVRGCFLKCRWCTLDREKPYQFMEIDLFKKIIGELARVHGGYYRIELFRGGEPFLHPDIRGLISIIRQTGAFQDTILSFYTNAMVFKKEQMEAIVDSSLHFEVVFSVDGVGTPESFEYMRPGARWNTVRKKIEQLHRLKKGSRYEGLKKIAVSTIIPHAKAVPFDVPDVKEVTRRIKEEFTPLGADIFYDREIHRWNGQIILDGMPVPEKRNGPCCFMKRGGMSILVDGRVSACCGDMDNRLVHGDLNKEPLDEIYYSEKLVKMREAMLMGERFRLDVCGACDLR